MNFETMNFDPMNFENMNVAYFVVDKYIRNLCLLYLKNKLFEKMSKVDFA